MINDTIRISSRSGTQIEPLTSVILPSFNISWENNSKYQIAFVLYNDNSVGFSLIEPENIIIWRGQQFVIKQTEPNHSSGFHTISVTATHIYLDIRKIFKHDKKNGTLTYSIEDVMSLYLKDNSFGYTYEIKGSFSKRQITDLGENTAFDGLSQIVKTWSDAVIFPDNKKIIIYSKDVFSKNLGNRLGYGHNSDNIKLTYDSTGLVNQLTIISTLDNNKNPYFPTHVLRDSISISKYGVWDGGNFSDERFHSAKAADAEAKNHFIKEPSISVTLDYLDGNEPIPGEIRRLEILDTGFITNIMVVAYTWYPFDGTQKTSLTLNSNAKTILDFQRSNNQQLNQAKQNSAALAKAIKDANSKLNVISQDGIWYEYGGKDVTTD